MKNISKSVRFGAIALLVFVAFSFTKSSGETKYKCMIQMTNYTGEGAYVVASLIKPDGSYEKTLYVSGKDTKWYTDIIHWYAFQKTKKQSLDGITGSSITGGNRSIYYIKIASDKLDKGYKIRFESAVESQVYHKSDIEMEFKSSNINQKIEGKGYIRYIRLMPG